MIIGLSGTHGTGKTTILQAAKAAGRNVDESQLSRTAQKMLGWDTLSRAQESIDNMWALQDAILRAMYDREQRILQSGRTVLVDRTPADAWAYTAMWCKRLNIDTSSPIQDKRASVYKCMCRDLAQHYSLFVVVPPIDAIPFVEEPNRADLASRKFVDDEIHSFIVGGGLPCHVMQFAEREHRAIEIETLITLCELWK